MKKKISIVIGVLIVILIASVAITESGKIRGTEGILDFAYEEIPIKGIPKEYYSIAGSVTKDNILLVWIMLGSEYNGRYYYPIEFNILKDDVYTLKHKYNYADGVHMPDIRYLQWGIDDEYVFMVNNPECEYINIYDENMELTQIKVDSIPFVYYFDEPLGDRWEFKFIGYNGGVIAE